MQPLTGEIEEGKRVPKENKGKKYIYSLDLLYT